MPVASPPASDVLATWVEAGRPAGQRDAVILAHAPLVKWVAGRTGSRLPAHVDAADLVSWGLIGLVDAIDRWDPERGVTFTTYAATRIRGAILDELRRADWAPRSIRDRARHVDRAAERLAAHHGRPPTVEELAVALGWAPERVEAARAGAEAPLELDRHPDSDSWALPPGAGAPDEDLLASADREELVAALGRLADRDRAMLVLYYWEGLTLGQIGEIYGVTESRVSQVHSASLSRLRRLLEAAARSAA